jgi:hypothetical protein
MMRGCICYLNFRSYKYTFPFDYVCELFEVITITEEAKVHQELQSKKKKN